MSGNDERYNVNICPICHRIPKEFYLHVMENTDFENTMWWIPVSKREHTDNKALILGSLPYLNEQNYKELIIKMVVCNACHNIIDDHTHIKFLLDNVKKALSEGNYFTWKVWHTYDEHNDR